MKQDEFNTEKKALAEVKKRVRRLLSGSSETQCWPSSMIINGVHEIRFKIRSKDGFIEGTVGIAAS